MKDVIKMKIDNINEIEKSKYLDISRFKQKSLDFKLYDENGSELKVNNEESISLSLMNSTVGYMSKFLYFTNNGETIDSALMKAFKPAFRGIDIMLIYSNICGEEADIFRNHIVKDITGLNPPSLIAACKLASYDIWLNKKFNTVIDHDLDSINLNEETLENLRIMIIRSLNFFDQYGPITELDFRFKTGGISFLTKDTMWYFNVLKDDITSEHTLQLLIHYLMGKRSKKEIFKNVKRLGFFNPRKGVVYTLKIARIPKKMINYISKEILCCYGKRK